MNRDCETAASGLQPHTHTHTHTVGWGLGAGRIGITDHILTGKEYIRGGGNFKRLKPRKVGLGYIFRVQILGFGGSLIVKENIANSSPTPQY